MNTLVIHALRAFTSPIASCFEYLHMNNFSTALVVDCNDLNKTFHAITLLIRLKENNYYLASQLLFSFV